MVFSNKWQSRLILSVACAIAANTAQSAAFAQARFNDVQGHWAQTCIEQLANRQIISGHQDGNFHPADPVTRAEFAVIVRKAFPDVAPVRETMNFADIPTDYWASDAIQYGYRANFLSGYSGRIFNPNKKITRLQALLALASGLKYSARSPVAETLKLAFEDVADIPSGGENGIAAATENQIVVNYPNFRRLKPNEEASRADVAAFICQGISVDKTALVPTQYIARTSSSPTTATRPQTPTPTPTPSTPSSTMTTKIEAVEMGNVRAEFSYQIKESTDPGTNLRVKISRLGQTLLDEQVLLPTRDIYNPNGAGQMRPQGRLLGLVVRDIDGDREPEIVADLLANASGSRCCSYSFIYRYEPAQNKYSHIEHFWANAGYKVTDVEPDGIPEFDSLDIRLANALNIPSGDAALPKQIWHYRQGQMIDVTKQYPQLISEHTGLLWETYQERRFRNEDVKGVLAAYMANKYLVAQEAEGWRLVREAYPDGDREDYFAVVRKLLTDFGYVSANAPTDTNPTPNPSPETTSSPAGEMKPLNIFSGAANPVFSMAIAPDGQTLAIGSDKVIQVWNLSTGQLSNTLSGHGGNVWSVAISSDSQTLVSCSGDTTIKLWNLRSGNLQRTFSHDKWVNFVAISPDGQTVASAYSTVKLWNASTGELQRSIEGFGPVIFSPDGQTVLSSDGQGTLQVRDVKTGELQRTFKVADTAGEGLSLMAMSPNGKTVASVRTGESTIKVWKVDTGELLYSLNGEVSQVNAIAISPDGQTLASATAEGKIQLWNLRNGDLRQSFKGYSMGAKGVAFGVKSNSLVTVGSDRPSDSNPDGTPTIKTWQLRS